MDSKMQTLATLELELLNKKQLISRVALSKLPDNGVRLTKRIQELCEQIEKLSMKSEMNKENPSSVNVVKKVDDFSIAKSNPEVKMIKNLEPRLHFKLDAKKNNTNDDNVDISTNKLKTEEASAKPINFKNQSFSIYRDPSVKPKPVIIEAPLINPEKSVKKCSVRNDVGSYWLNDYSQDAKKAVENLYSALKTCPAGSEMEDSPLNLKTPLLKHQLTALKWLLWREKQDMAGGIFADDMGLGKTLSLISLILKSYENNAPASNTNDFNGTLIVCPPSLVRHWDLEISKHCKDNSLKVLMYHGLKRKSNFTDYDVVITTYNLILVEGKRKDSLLFSTRWSRIILDEAHIIKNFKSQTAQKVVTLNGTKKWAVTGTPIHNNLKDLYSLILFLKLDPFDNIKIWEKFIDDQSDLSTERRNALIKGIMLRRCKNDNDENGVPIIKLPKKHMRLYNFTLKDEEQGIYDNIFNKLKETVSKQASGRKAVKNSSNKDGTFLSLFLKLQQCCSHLSLLKMTQEEEVSSDFVDLNLSSAFNSMNMNDKSSNSAEEINLSIIQDKKFTSKDCSSKLNLILSKVQRVLRKGEASEKCVIVSQWVSLLNIVGDHLKSSNINYHTIIGATNPEERVDVCEDFNNNLEGPRVLLLSLKAGGVGLNLIGGNHLFLVDLHWNPSLEDQACDRIYRVGQSKEVYIYKFICNRTIEEKIYALQKEKRELAKNVLSGAKKVENITMDELKSLFRKQKTI